MNSQEVQTYDSHAPISIPSAVYSVEDCCIGFLMAKDGNEKDEVSARKAVRNKSETLIIFKRGNFDVH